MGAFGTKKISLIKIEAAPSSLAVCFADLVDWNPLHVS